LIGIGIAAGVVSGLMRRPTLMRVAMEVDRQFELHDLLSTVVAGQTRGDQAFGAVVAQQAQETCARISPNELIVRKLGGSAWGGIGITTGLVLSVAMMSSGPGVSQARVGDVDVKSVGELSSRSEAVARTGNSQLRRDGASDLGRDPREEGRPMDEGRQEQIARAREERGDESRADGAGGAAGRSNDARSEMMKPRSADESRDADPGAETSEASVSSSQKPRAAPKWTGEHWRADRENASRDLNSGRVPDAYRDLVREYFDRSGK
jgi:hypothetical protein